MVVPAYILQQAIDLYLRFAYPAGVSGSASLPPEVVAKLAPVRVLDAVETVPLNLMDRDVVDASASYALRLGQPIYPFMKLVLDPLPAGGGEVCCGQDFLLRADAHDRHLHAPEGSPDADWLAKVRASNRELVDKIESAWAAAGLPTFKEFLRRQLEARRRAKVE